MPGLGDEDGRARSGSFGSAAIEGAWREGTVPYAEVQAAAERESDGSASLLPAQCRSQPAPKTSAIFGCRRA